MDLAGILVLAFVGYAVGRISHIIGGRLGDKDIHVPYSPHHWVYGVLAAALGPIFLSGTAGYLVLAFGIGMIISDLNDLLHGRVFDPSHEPDDKKFWGID